MALRRSSLLIVATLVAASCEFGQSPVPGSPRPASGPMGGMTVPGDGGPATAAYLDDPWGLAVDATGNVYVSDENARYIRRIGVDGRITTVAGNTTGGPETVTTTVATEASLNMPRYLAFDPEGDL